VGNGSKIEHQGEAAALKPRNQGVHHNAEGSKKRKTPKKKMVVKPGREFEAKKKLRRDPAGDQKDVSETWGRKIGEGGKTKLWVPGGGWKKKALHWRPTA